MSIRKLFDGDFEAYFQTTRDDGKALWFFVHIPKTAGSSFRSELATNLRPQVNITLNYAVTGESFENWRQAAVARFTSEAMVKRPRFASGHIMRRLLDDARAHLPDMRLITMLRHPVDRVISDYRYARTPAHPPHQKFIQTYPTIDHYIESSEAADKMAVFLEATPNQPTQELIDQLEREFSFVGLTEMYPLSRRTLFNLLGLRVGPAQRKRTTESTADNQVQETPELREKIAAANPRDMALYRHFRQRWVQQKEALLAYLADHRLPPIAPGRPGKAQEPLPHSPLDRSAAAALHRE